MLRLKSPTLFLPLAALLAILAGGVARAQDPFEIQVYEYKTVPKGMWNLETHINFVGRGTKESEGPVAPSNHQFHLTFELTHGITEHFETAGYLVLAQRPGGGFEYVGWRIRPRFRLPQSWNLPVDISLSTEVGFPRKTYEENSVTLEVRPIIEKRFGRFQIDVNPVVGRALRGPGVDEGWDFEPGVRLGYELNRRLNVSLEYYGAVGPLGDLLPTDEQVHQLYPGGDLKFGDNIIVNFGIGFGVTEAGNRLVYKMRIGYLFGKKN